MYRAPHLCHDPAFDQGQGHGSVLPGIPGQDQVVTLQPHMTGRHLHATSMQKTTKAMHIFFCLSLPLLLSVSVPLSLLSPPNNISKAWHCHVKRFKASPKMTTKQRKVLDAVLWKCRIAAASRGQHKRPWDRNAQHRA